MSEDEAAKKASGIFEEFRPKLVLAVRGSLNMRITRLVIENYKSVKSIDVRLNGKLNAIIGANSVGKSNIFEAINWILGPVYPTFNRVTKEDHFLADENNLIRIKLEFDDGHSLELNERKQVANFKGEAEVRSGLFYDNQAYNCKGEIRERYCSAYLDVERKILDYLPSNRWSLVGRILQEINRQFMTEDYEHNGERRPKKEWLKKWLEYSRDKLLFSVKDRSGDEVMKKFVEILQTESALQLNRSKNDFKVDLSLYDPWNFYRTLQLLVKEEDMGLEFQASSLGMGVQASISIAILKAYSEINLANKTPILIDEPELFLHPQAQRNFYRLLRELATDKSDGNGELVREGTQIIYSTHSANFLSAGSFDEIFLTRKSRDKGTYLSFGVVGDFCQDFELRTGKRSTDDMMLLHYKNAYEHTGDTQKANEAFFASKIILVEGQSESLVFPLFFERLGRNLEKEGYSIVACGSKHELDRFFRLYSEFGIPCFLVFDGDKQLENTTSDAEVRKGNRALLELVGLTGSDFPDGKVGDRHLGFLTRFEDALGYQTQKKGLDLFIEVQAKLEAGEIGVPSWVAEMWDRLGKLAAAGSVLRRPKKPLS